MAMTWKKTLLLGLMVAAVVAATTSAEPDPGKQATVTISNPAKMVVNFMIGEMVVEVTTDMMTVNLDEPQQDIMIQTTEGQMTEVSVQNGDVLVLYRDSEDPRNVSVQVVSGGGSTVTAKGRSKASPQSNYVGIRTPPAPKR